MTMARSPVEARRSAMLGVFTAERCLEHRVPAAFRSGPSALSRIVDHLRGRGLDDRRRRARR